MGSRKRRATQGMLRALAASIILSASPALADEVLVLKCHKEVTKSSNGNNFAQDETVRIRVGRFSVWQEWSDTSNYFGDNACALSGHSCDFNGDRLAETNTAITDMRITTIISRATGAITTDVVDERTDDFDHYEGTCEKTPDPSANTTRKF